MSDSAPAGRRKRKVRHHVNPLGFVREVVIPRWEERFAHPERPLEVDVGFMHGTFLLGRAAQAPLHNFVGLEIRKPLVEEVEERVRRRGLENVALVLCNANTSFNDLFAPASLHRVHVHFPDPWFKKRHHKRRLMTPAFLDDLATRLEDGGELHFMTDYGEYAAEVLELVEAHPAFANVFGPRAPALAEEGRVLSHREEWHLRRGDPIHRYRWRRRPRGGGEGAGA